MLGGELKFPLAEERSELLPGDILIAYTDGVTDSITGKHVSEKIGSIIPQAIHSLNSGPRGIAESIFDYSSEHLNDDATVLVVKVK
jgi:serine phosphatase RsbU (regulator of sigma subunit)